MFLDSVTGVQKIPESLGLSDTEASAIEVVTAIIFFVCSVNILNGANWARWFYAVTSGCLFILDGLVFIEHYSILVALIAILRVGVVILLFLPDANDYFSSPQM